MSDKTLAAVGAAIRAARKTTGFSQEELASRVGLHRTYIGSVERGERNLGVKNLVAIARALNLPPSDLLRNLDGSSDRRRR